MEPIVQMPPKLAMPPEDSGSNQIIDDIKPLSPKNKGTDTKAADLALKADETNPNLRLAIVATVLIVVAMAVLAFLAYIKKA